MSYTGDDRFLLKHRHPIDNRVDTENKVGRAKATITVAAGSPVAAGTYSTDLSLPAGAVVKRVFYKVGTTFTSATDAATIALQIEGADDVVAAVAISAATEDLRSARGNTAVIIFSDGRETDRMAVTAAKEMKEQLGDRLCIYTVLFGDDPVGKSLMEQIADVGECGYFVSAEEIYPSEGMATLAENVFLEKAAAPEPVGALLEEDSDGDGVLDNQDECPDTPK